MTRPSRFRFNFVFAGTVFLVAALMYYAGHLSTGGMSLWEVTLSVCAAIVCYFLSVALGEWIAHRYVYHRPWRSEFMNHIHTLHQVHHHWRYYPPTEYTRDGDVDYISVLPSHAYRLCKSPFERATAYAGQYLLYVLPMVLLLIVPGWLVSRNWAFTITLLILTLFMCHMFVRVHDYIHQPAGRWMERQFWFKFLNQHHYIHHVDTESNVNFLLPLGDLLLGTLRTQLTRAELAKWPSFEDAVQHVFPNLRPLPDDAVVDPVIGHTTPR